ncbi:MAG: hypothetical protein ACRCWF_17690 [Beijerinckiaceae bacterium]
MANKYRGSVRFPLFEGVEGFESLSDVVLRYTTGDQVRLQEMFKPDGKSIVVNIHYEGDRAGTATMDVRDFRSVLEPSIRSYVPSVIKQMLQIGMKKAEDEKTKVSIAESTFEDLPFTFSEAAGYVLDAFLLSLLGKTDAEVAADQAALQRAAEQARKTAEDDDPPFLTGAETISEPSLMQEHELDSTPMLSGA